MKRVTVSAWKSAIFGSRKWQLALSSAALIAIGSALAAGVHHRTAQLQNRLLALAPEDVSADPALLRFASAQARPLYVQHCAACHGADLRGNPAIGAPNLTDDVWLYGEGRLFDIERTILYGVRSGDDRSHNEADMPAFGLRGILSANQIGSVVQFLMQLNGRPYLTEAASEGRTLYATTGNCGDCHGPDGHGNNDYGAPDMTRNVWNSGGDPKALYATIYSGQHRIMPAWRGTLTLEQIRALAAYVYNASHPQ
jgi:cytochrome c oxidase cbb3-type subunit 3